MKEISTLRLAEGLERPERTIFTVKELTTQIKDLLENRFLLVWVEGEISQIKNHDSGHIFFSLKDEEALLKAIMFRDKARKLPFPLREGLKVLCFGRISVYPPRGEYRLIVQQIEPRGLGSLQLAFEALKRELAARGYFDEARKKSLPAYPERVAVVTSISGAALHDFLRVARERWQAEILIYPVRVQGEGAAEDIARAIDNLNRLKDLDLIVITRGGGSLEDLWAFNERIVAEAVFRSRIPVVSAVGHEVDYTICDFVADLRAPTPTAAAQQIFPDRKQLIEDLDSRKRRLFELISERLRKLERELHHLSKRLKSPEKLIQETGERVQDLEARLRKALAHQFFLKENRFRNLVRHLEAVSPLAVLSRGYSVTRKLPEKIVIRKAQEVRTGEFVEILLEEGRLEARVERIHPDNHLF